jgi:hypothetical protein
MVETYRPEFQACKFPAEKEVKVSGPWEAVQASKKIEVQRAFYQRAYQCIESTKVADYHLLNEAERDQEYLNETIDFILERPILWIEVTFYKSLLFFWGSSGRFILSILAVLGALLAIKNRKSVILLILIFAYSVSYSLALPFFYRYRYPIEPLILILASSTIIFIIQFFYRWFQRKG